MQARKTYPEVFRFCYAMAIDLWTFFQMMFLTETGQFLSAEIDQLEKSEISPKLGDWHTCLGNKILNICVFCLTKKSVQGEESY